LIKCILHLRHSCVPANQHLRHLNNHCDRGATTTDCSKPQLPIEPLSVKRRESSIFGILSAFGLGGCNATVVFQTTGIETKPRAPDPQSPSFYVETCVETWNAFLSSTRATYIGQLIFGSETTANPVLVRSQNDVSGVRVWNYLPVQ